MNTSGTEQYTPNGMRDQTAGSPGRSETMNQGGQTSSGYAGQTSGAAGQTSGSTGRKTSEKPEGVSIDSLMNFARDIQTKVKDVPYLVPIAIGGAGFVLGVLASSRILRQMVVIASGYAVKYAVENAPKDEVLSFAKKIIVDSFHQAQRS